MEKQIIYLIKEKETKRTIRYKEEEVPGQPLSMQTIYLPKYLQSASRIKVTLEDAHE